MAINDSVQQLVYFAPADIESLLRRMREKHNFRIAVNEDVGEDGPEWHESVDAIASRVRLGVSTTGDLWPRLWVQFQPYLPIPVDFVGGTFRGKFAAGGSIEFSTGGIFEKTGELVSGRIAFTLWFKEDAKTFDFRNKAWGYEAILGTAKSLGARNYKSYLIGAAAWDLFQNGNVLIQMTGTKLLLQ